LCDFEQGVGAYCARERRRDASWTDGRLKVFRLVASRYDTTLLSYVGVVATAAFVVALSGWGA
jgi:hypothetical protein